MNRWESDEEVTEWEGVSVRLNMKIVDQPSLQSASHQEERLDQRIVYRAIEGGPMTAGMRDAVAADLRNRLLVCQYGVDQSTKASDWCLLNVPLIGNEAVAA